MMGGASQGCPNDDWFKIGGENHKISRVNRGAVVRVKIPTFDLLHPMKLP